MAFIRKYALYLAWIVSLVATAGSLYMSEVLHWEPCSLCWYQRIFMYPLVILLGIGAYKNDNTIVQYALPLPIIGGLISTYHYMKQMIPGFAAISPCRVGVPCEYDYLDGSWMTIPLLALIAFVLITICLLMARKQQTVTIED
ncbi:disulfide oxidoreductase [Paenibacillus marinisediminis]